MFSARVRLAGVSVLLATGYWIPATGFQQPTFRAGVTLVTTDAIARTDAGNFVADLTKDNFTILEDGQPQKIESFVLVQGGRTFNLLTPAPAAPEGIILPGPRPRANDTNGRVLLIIVDDLHFEAELTPHVRRLITTISETLLHDGDLAAIVSTGPSYIEIAPTYDRKLIVEAANKIRGSGYTPTDIFNMMESSQGVGDMRSRAQMAFYTTYDILSQLENIANRRKAVLFISTGYDFDPFAEGRAGNDRVMGGRYGNPIGKLIDEDNPFFAVSHVTADIDLYRLLRELTLSANRANASIYTIDPRGLAGVTDAGHQVDQSSWRTYIQKTTSSLKYLAEETGAFAIVDTNDFEAGLKRVDAETSDYYVLGYYSTNPDPAHRTRQIEVKVDRPGVSVMSRRAYSLKTAGTPPAPPALKPPPKKKP